MNYSFAFHPKINLIMKQYNNIFVVISQKKSTNEMCLHILFIYL